MAVNPLHPTQEVTAAAAAAFQPVPPSGRARGHVGHVQSAPELRSTQTTDGDQARTAPKKPGGRGLFSTVKEWWTSRSVSAPSAATPPSPPASVLPVDEWPLDMCIDMEDFMERLASKRSEGGLLALVGRSRADSLLYRLVEKLVLAHRAEPINQDEIHHTRVLLGLLFREMSSGFPAESAAADYDACRIVLGQCLIALEPISRAEAMYVSLLDSMVGLRYRTTFLNDLIQRWSQERLPTVDEAAEAMGHVLVDEEIYHRCLREEDRARLRHEIVNWMALMPALALCDDPQFPGLRGELMPDSVYARDGQWTRVAAAVRRHIPAGHPAYALYATIAVDELRLARAPDTAVDAVARLLDAQLPAVRVAMRATHTA